ncbi:MAG: hypothetical protein Q7R72_01290 [bacterium]|nr:hypothetical protein [bacterium]
MPLLAQWEKLAKVVTENVMTLPNCKIKWDLTFFRESERCMRSPVEGDNDWAIRCSVSQIQKIYKSDDSGLTFSQTVVAPIIEIGEVAVYKDSTFWKNHVHEYSVDDRAIKELITALQTGKWIPRNPGDPDNYQPDPHSFVVNKIQLPTG